LGKNGGKEKGKERRCTGGKGPTPTLARSAGKVEGRAASPRGMGHVKEKKGNSPRSGERGPRSGKNSIKRYARISGGVKERRNRQDDSHLAPGKTRNVGTVQIEGSVNPQGGSVKKKG